MTLNFKNTSSLLLIFMGFAIFFLNITELNFENNYINPNKDQKKNISIVSVPEKKLFSEINENKDSDILKKNENLQKFTKYTKKVKKGQTFSEILDGFKFNNSEKYKLITAINEFYDLRGLKVDQIITFYSDSSELIKKILIELDYKTNLIINLTPKIEVKKEVLDTYSEIESKNYIIESSLYKDGIDNQVPNEILVKLIRLFSFDLDFQRDIRKNTEVSISYEKVYVQNKSILSFGDIEYAKITIQKKHLEYFKFITNEGFVDYFNREGKNVKKSILKTPLDGARISSNYGMRKHPISGFNKMHKGIDFAAPKGTPIYAGGNGVIELIGNNGGYGKYIRIRHNNEFKTAYAHLNSYKKGLSKGSRVNQGEVIGYVGSTGNSTGPHLHYEIIYQNRQINPLTLELPSGKILTGDEFKRFEIKYKMILADHLNNLFE